MDLHPGRLSDIKGYSHLNFSQCFGLHFKYRDLLQIINGHKLNSAKLFNGKSFSSLTNSDQIEGNYEPVWNLISGRDQVYPDYR